jgi:galactokinase
LSQDYEVSCPELDFLVEQTKDKEYILGARMMGGGFGGCSINMIKKDQIKHFIEEIGPKYKEQFGKDMTPIEVEIRDGSSKLSSSSPF